jgi:hypothetical protein
MNDLEGAYRLVMRVLPDGTVQTPPTVQGWFNIQNGLEQTTLLWSTTEGKPASLSQIDKIEVHRVFKRPFPPAINLLLSWRSVNGHPSWAWLSENFHFA